MVGNEPGNPCQLIGPQVESYSVQDTPRSITPLLNNEQGSGCWVHLIDYIQFRGQCSDWFSSSYR